MATQTIQANSANNNSAIVAALLRAIQMDKNVGDGSADDPESQLAWAALTGAASRTLECGISSADHAAAAALLAFKEIETVTDGYARHLDGRKVIDHADAERALRIVRHAMLGIWMHLRSEHPALKSSLAPLAEYCETDRFQ